MPFQYPNAPHDRKHGPEGYDSYSSYKDWLRDEFTFRCVYCLERERWYPNGDASFGVDHVLAKSMHPHLACVYSNLVYACNRCNSAKGSKALLDPCQVAFGNHLAVAPDGTITGLTTEGRILVDVLQLDRPEAVAQRKHYLDLLALYTTLLTDHPAIEQTATLYAHTFGFPDDLPDLRRARPQNNSREGSDRRTHYFLRLDNMLPAVYAVEAPPA